ncbi:hypothetical protein VP01_721g1 [Puccinia sorghi]|uniref:Uncharacterized protein n=1 Tax=Puccinia sorghi TaxID=27349 RepID=A0A0L6UFD8_9BASI|nr:hypothetical protein VP01_721g1 [Puccinia sorghi]
MRMKISLALIKDLIRNGRGRENVGIVSTFHTPCHKLSSILTLLLSQIPINSHLGNLRSHHQSNLCLHHSSTYPLNSFLKTLLFSSLVFPQFCLSFFLYLFQTPCPFLKTSSVNLPCPSYTPAILRVCCFPSFILISFIYSFDFFLTSFYFLDCPDMNGEAQHGSSKSCLSVPISLCNCHNGQGTVWNTESQALLSAYTRVASMACACKCFLLACLIFGELGPSSHIKPSTKIKKTLGFDAITVLWGIAKWRNMFDYGCKSALSPNPMAVHYGDNMPAAVRGAFSLKKRKAWGRVEGGLIHLPPTHPNQCFFFQLSHCSNFMNFTIRLVGIQAENLNHLIKNYAMVWLDTQFLFFGRVVLVLLSFHDWGCQE